MPKHSQCQISNNFVNKHEILDEKVPYSSMSRGIFLFSNDYILNNRGYCYVIIIIPYLPSTNIATEIKRVNVNISTMNVNIPTRDCV